MFIKGSRCSLCGHIHVSVVSGHNLDVGLAFVTLDIYVLSRYVISHTLTTNNVACVYSGMATSMTTGG